MTDQPLTEEREQQTRDRLDYMDEAASKGWANDALAMARMVTADSRVLLAEIDRLRAALHQAEQDYAEVQTQRDAAMIERNQTEAERDEPLLGLATTAELLAELTARAEVGGYAGYRTVDGHGEDELAAVRERLAQAEQDCHEAEQNRGEIAVELQRVQKRLARCEQFVVDYSEGRIDSLVALGKIGIALRGEKQA